MCFHTSWGLVAHRNCSPSEELVKAIWSQGAVTWEASNTELVADAFGAVG